MRTLQIVFKYLLLLTIISTLSACDDFDAEETEPSKPPSSIDNSEASPLIPSQLILSGVATTSSSPTITWDGDVSLFDYEISIGTEPKVSNIMEFTPVLELIYRADNLELFLNTIYFFNIRAKNKSGVFSSIVSSPPWKITSQPSNDAYQFTDGSIAKNCKEYKDSHNSQSKENGLYWVDPDGEGSQEPLIAYCDMQTDDGGWTLIMNYNHMAGTFPSIKSLNNHLPHINSNELGSDESFVVSAWGQVSPELLNKFTFNHLRFYCETSLHERKIHFKTNNLNTIQYITSGLGNTSGLSTQFTPLVEHSANLPAASTGGFENLGHEALSNFPFYNGGLYHWAAGATGRRWECDDFAGSYQNNTIHRVWIK